MSTFFRGITETIPSLFRGIFSERNSVPNPPPPPPWKGGNPGARKYVTERKSARGTKSGAGRKSPKLVIERSRPPTPCIRRVPRDAEGRSSTRQREDVKKGSGGGGTPPMPKKWGGGGGKEAEASVEQGGPPEASQVTGSCLGGLVIILEGKIWTEGIELEYHIYCEIIKSPRSPPCPADF